MLTRKQKTLLENHIYRMLKESIFENGFPENFYLEKKDKHEEHDDDDDVKPSHESDDGDVTGRREIVLKWLDSDLELHSVLSYELWPGKNEDSARSLFSKKYRGHDDDGKEYSFTDEEINTLYNLRGKYIKKHGLNQTA
jgi:hypothetical protein